MVQKNRKKNNNDALIIKSILCILLIFVKSILVTEDANSGTNITISLVNATGAIFNIAKTKPIAALATVQILDEPLIMQESEVLKVQAGDANELFVISSILEINREDR